MVYGTFGQNGPLAMSRVEEGLGGDHVTVMVHSTVAQNVLAVIPAGRTVTLTSAQVRDV